MVSTLPYESLSGAFETLCYCVTVLAAMVSYLLARPA
jgi:hypothetical protein